MINMKGFTDNQLKVMSIETSPRGKAAKEELGKRAEKVVKKAPVKRKPRKKAVEVEVSSENN